MTKTTHKKSSQKSHRNNTRIHFNALDWFCFIASAIISVAIILFYHENPPFYTIMSIVALNGGVIETILNIKGYRINYLFAFFESFACFYTSWAQHFIGNALINLVFYAPATIIGFYSWGKHSNKNKKSHRP